MKVIINIYIFQATVASQPEEISEPERQKLQEKWEASKCKTKLIAL